MNTENKKILIALDNAKQSMNAALYASEILPSKQVDIVLYHVRSETPEFLWELSGSVDTGWLRGIIDDWTALQDTRITDTLQRAKKYFVNAGFDEKSVHIRIETVKTGIARDIIAEAKKGYSAVVMGRIGSSNICGVKIGGVTQKLIDKIGHNFLNGLTLIVVDGKPDPKKILIGFDGSKGAQKAVSYVAEMINRTDHLVTICEVIRAFQISQDDHADLIQACRNHPFPEEIEKQLQHRDSKILPLIEASKKKLIAAGLEEKHVDSVILQGYASRACGLVDKARADEYGTIVLGRQGVSAVKDFMFGRVGKKVLNLADNLAVWIVAD